MFVDQRLASEVRRRQGEPFQRDPAVLAVRVERFPFRQVLDREFEDVDNDVTADAAGPPNAAPHVGGGLSPLIRLFGRLPAITAQAPAEFFGFPDVDAVPVIEGHFDQVDTRLLRSSRKAN